MSEISIAYIKPLGAWFAVRGADLTPVTGSFASLEAARAWIKSPLQKGKNPFRFIPPGYKLYKVLGDVMIYTEPAGEKVFAKIYVGKAGKAEGSYCFLSQERLDSYIIDRFLTRQKMLAEKQQRKIERSKPTGVKVGDVFEASWGYEQTNIDYYQVTRLVGRQSVEVRGIRQLSIETGDMRGKCAPAIGDFKGEPMIKRLQNNSGTATIKIASYAQAYLLAPVGMIGDVPVYRPANWTAYA